MKWTKLIGEAVIIFALIFSINNFFKNQDQLLNADGKGYYDYLPSLFIYGDLPAFNQNKNELTVLSERISKADFFVPYKNGKVNKYPCGVAVLLFPTFVYTHLTAKMQGYANDGFSLPYQQSAFYAALIYLFLGLFFLRKLLSFYEIKAVLIFVVQVFVVFSTSMINYVYSDPAFSHVYSFFAVTAFLFFSKSYFVNKNTRHFLWACVFLGLVVILRQVNILVVLFIPFIAGSFENLKLGIELLFKKWFNLIKGVFLFIAIVFIQLYLWHFQTGDYFVDSYQGEYFDFLHPHFIDILFSYRKGLFIYTPVMIFSFLGMFFYIKQKKHYLFFCWLFFFLLLTYILSSWYCWDFGYTYGLRAYIDFYSVFCIAIGIAIQGVPGIFKIILIAIMSATIPLNYIQTWQFKRYILHGNDMNKQKYWDVVLRTEPRFAGMLLKKPYNFTAANSKIIYSKGLGNCSVLPNTTKEIQIGQTNDIKDFEKINLIQLSFENTFGSEDDSHIEFYIRGLESNIAYMAVGTPLIHFQEKGLNMEQTGSYVYELPKIENKENNKIYMNIVSKDKSLELKNIMIKYYEYH